MLIYIFITGLAIGSFLNAMVDRMIKSENFVNDRSKCDHCSKTLRWYDLVPLFSWVSTAGRCRYCNKRLGAGYPLSELATGVLFATSYIYWPIEVVGLEIVAFIAWLLALSVLIALAIYDLREFILPDQYLVALVIFTSIFHAANYPDIEYSQLAFGILAGGGFFQAIYEVSKGKWIGFGDVKMGYVAGLLLGLDKVIVGTLIGFYSASALILPLLLAKKVTRKSRIPFGPFLIIGYIVAFLFGNEIYAWLTDVLLYNSL